MLGWHITVFRFGDSSPIRIARGDADAMRAILTDQIGTTDVPEPTDQELRMATWQTGLAGLDWLDPLIAGGRAIATSHGGYPERYLIVCADFRSCLEQGLPAEKPVWTADPGDVLTDCWIGHTAVDADALAQCDPDEWLVVEAWDES